MVGGKTLSAPASMAVVGIDVRVVEDISEVDYIEGAMHSAWKVATEI